MKAEELMIGDWVYGCTDPYETDRDKKKYPVKVIRIDADGDTMTEGDNPFTEPYEDEWWNLEPIPLTPEILEKNGFITGYDGAHIGHDNNLKMYHKYIGKAHIVVNYLDDGKVGIEISNEFSPKDDRGRADLVTFARDWCNGFCVHELQHALRFCGIGKEITV